MKMKKNKYLKSIAFMTAVFFLGQNLLATSSIAAISVLSPGKNETLPFILQLPSALGVVKEYQAEAPKDARKFSPFIVHLQDAHANPAAQQKIHDILKWLKENSPEDRMLLALEGAEGLLHPEYFDFFPEYPEVNEAIVKDLADKGELTGAELFAWEIYKKSKTEKAPSKIIFKGVETPYLYRENLKIYRHFLFVRPEIEKVLEPLKQSLEKIKSLYLSVELRNFLLEKERRKEGAYPGSTEATPQLAAYLDFLTAQANEKLQIDLTRSVEQIRFPQMVRFKAISKLSRELDLEKANNEKAKLISVLSKAANKTDEKNIIQMMSSGQPFDRMAAERFWLFPVRAKVNLNDYPQYLKSIGLAVLQSEIKSNGLFREIDRLEKALLRKMARSEKEKECIRRIEEIKLLERLMHLELGHRDYVKVQAARMQPAAIFEHISQLDPSGKSIKIDLPLLEAFYREAIRFYGLAHQRDREILSHTFAEWHKQQTAFPSNRLLTVLITGGFHTEGLMNEMKKAGAGYGIVQPQFKATDPSLSMKVFKDENADISNYLGRIYAGKQQSLLLKEIIEVSLPLLRNKFGLSQDLLKQKISVILNHHPVFKETFSAETISPSALKLKISAAPEIQPTLSPEAATVGETLEMVEAPVFTRLRPSEQTVQTSGTGTFELDFNATGIVIKKASRDARLELRVGNIVDIKKRLGAVSKEVDKQTHAHKADGPLRVSVTAQIRNILEILKGEKPEEKKVFQAGALMTGLAAQLREYPGMNEIGRQVELLRDEMLKVFAPDQNVAQVPLMAEERKPISQPNQDDLSAVISRIEEQSSGVPLINVLRDRLEIIVFAVRHHNLPVALKALKTFDVDDFSYTLESASAQRLKGDLQALQGILTRSELRADNNELHKILEDVDFYLRQMNGIPKRRSDNLLRIRELAVVDHPQYREDIVKWLKAKWNAQKSDQDGKNLEEAVRAIEALNIGIVGAEDGGLTTAAILGKAGHFLTLVDEPKSIEKIQKSPEFHYEQIRQTIGDSHLKPVEIDSGSDKEAVEKRTQKMAELIRTNDIIYLDSDMSSGMDYESYLGKLIGRAMDLGNALDRVRKAEIKNNEPHKRKLIIVRAMTDVETSQQIYNKIKWHARSDSPGVLNFDVVFQPVLYQDDTFSEPYVLFGVRGKEGDPERVQTEEMLRKIYALDTLKTVEFDFVNIRSAEQAKDDLLLYLGSKLAHFNDLAQLADRYGADLSVVALGAGLDKRIRTLFTNPSLGFGGRLLLLMKWIYQQRLRQLTGKMVGNHVYANPAEIEYFLESSFNALESGKKEMVAVLEDMPKELHLLFWIKAITRINERNQQDFLNKIEKGYAALTQNTLRGKSVALLGVRYSHKSTQITESPVLNLIRRLVKDKHVHEFYVVDPEAKAKLKKWLDKEREKDSKFSSVLFRGIDDESDYDFYDAIQKSDLSIIATDSHDVLQHLDMNRLAQALSGKPLFDGINLFGLRADGKTQYSLDVMREATYRDGQGNEQKGIHLVSVGRPSLGPKFDWVSDYYLQDSSLYKNINEYPIKEFNRMNVTIVGGGYVGLTTAANLSNLGPDQSTEGHVVTVVELPKFQNKIDGLNSEKTVVPIYEPGLREMIIEGKREEEGKKKRTLFFSTDLAAALKESEVVYLAVGTPQQDTGEIDLSYILSAAEQIGDAIIEQKKAGLPNFAKTIVIKSTVTPDTFPEIDKRLRKKGLKLGDDFLLVSNPEFLREGQAITDVTKPDRTVLGFYAKMPVAARLRAQQQLLNLWYPLVRRHPHDVLVTDTATSTLIKYAANSFLAISISLANTLAEDAELSETDFAGKILRKDRRIGPFAFLDPGCGYGGSCFPKDVRALDFISFIKTADRHPLFAIQLADRLNDKFKMSMVTKTLEGISYFPGARDALEGKTIALWGMTFKPDTDDVREAPGARILYELLIREPEHVFVHDPIFNIPNAPEKKVIVSRFIKEMRKFFIAGRQYFENSLGGEEMTPQKMATLEAKFETWFTDVFIETGRLTFVDQPQEVFAALPQALLLLTDWKQYAGIKIEEFVQPGSYLRIFDGRNLWAKRKEEFRIAGIGYKGVGVRSELRKADSSVMNDLISGSESTPVFERRFFNLSVLPKTKLADLERDEPGLTARRNVAFDIAENIFPSDMVDEKKIRFLQLAFAPKDSEIGNPLQKLAREILGKKYFDFLTSRSDMPIHIFYPVHESKVPDGVLPFLAISGTHDQLTEVGEFSEAEAQRLEAIFRKDLSERFKMPASLAENFQVVGTTALVSTLKRGVAEERKKQTGVLDESLEFLEELGYVRGRERFFTDGMTSTLAPVLAATLLRQQYSDSYTVRNIRKEMEARGIDIQDLVARMGQLIAAIQHIATQA